MGWSEGMVLRFALNKGTRGASLTVPCDLIRGFLSRRTIAEDGTMKTVSLRETRHPSKRTRR